MHMTCASFSVLSSPESASIPTDIEGHSSATSPASIAIQKQETVPSYSVRTNVTERVLSNWLEVSPGTSTCNQLEKGGSLASKAQGQVSETNAEIKTAAEILHLKRRLSASQRRVSVLEIENKNLKADIQCYSCVTPL
ncbi:uncharacterized protein LOC142587991 [Dermacentor variabilis]|uniref:uncharacterized protein LOC142587991 n=1 Tax=Dermacentor variabilis TaxID=34621 RepID=UPI003F5C88B2